jgi:hypothetical protein
MTTPDDNTLENKTPKNKTLDDKTLDDNIPDDNTPDDNTVETNDIFRGRLFRIYVNSSSTGLLFFIYQCFIISTEDRNMNKTKNFIYSRMTVRIYFSRMPHLDKSIVSVFQCVFSYIIYHLVGVGHVSDLNLDYMAFLTHHINQNL